MMWFPNIAFLLLTLSTIVYGDKPGAKIQITNHGLKMAVEMLLNKMLSNDTEQQIPDVTGSGNIASEDMSYEFTQIHLDQFHHGTIVSQWIQETGMYLKMENGDAKISCNWKIDSWLIKDSGRSLLTLTGLSVSIMVGVRRNDPGVPSIYLLDCQSSVQGVDIQMSGGVSYFFDTIKEPIQNVVKQAVNQQLCSSIRNQAKKWDEKLRNFNLNLTLTEEIKLDLYLVGNPEISDQSGSFGIKGRFYSYNESLSKTDFSPVPMTIPIQDTAMLYTGVSQSSLDTFCSAFYSAGFLTYQVSHMVGSKELTTANLTAYVPEISQHFPSPVPVKIHMYATRSPRVYLLPNNLTVQFGGALQAYAYPTEAKAEQIFSVNLVASFQVNISISEARGAEGLNFTGSMILDRLQIEGSQPVSKDQKAVVTENGVRQLFHDVVMPVVNDELAQGIYTPSTLLKNGTVSTEKEFAILALDLK
ncbi:BPI fold-containing family C protein-like [Leptodactylus fuscus]|uniref:BPI fold-containing family C protein-like n=1 Tax=Leptodactylus fuscus TaxID=238119 RepID=UPI003F4F3C7A